MDEEGRGDEVMVGAQRVDRFGLWIALVGGP
jgi:hypothetical protein